MLRRIFWALLLIGLIGGAAGAVVFFTQQGHVKVVKPSIAVSIDTEFGEIVQGGKSSPHPFTITNTSPGILALKLTYSTTLDPLVGALTLSDTGGADINGLCLADDATVSGNAVLAIQQAAAEGDYSFALEIAWDFC